MEIEGLDSAAPTLGQGAADRLIPPLAAVMLQNTRAADVLARIGRRRFVALLPETDEVAAINYVERVRCACDMWMEARGLVGRMAIGWAQPSIGGSLADVLGLADDRVDADRHRQGFGTPSVTAVPLTPRTMSHGVRQPMTRSLAPPAFRQGSTLVALAVALVLLAFQVGLLVTGDSSGPAASSAFAYGAISPARSPTTSQYQVEATSSKPSASVGKGPSASWSASLTEVGGALTTPTSRPTPTPTPTPTTTPTPTPTPTP
jgi:hypothetical protein